MNARRNYLFVRACADNGFKYGLGHIVRTIEILNELSKIKNFNYKVIFLTNGGTIVSSYIRENFRNYKEAKIFHIKKKNLYKIFFTSIKRSDVFYSDNLGKDTKIINNLIKLGLKKIICLDDLQNKLTSKSVIINSIYSLKKKLNYNLYPKGINIYQSLKYLPLKKHFQDRKIIKKKKILRKILISTGGADYNNLSFNLISQIRNSKNIKINLLVGKGFLNYKPIYKLKKKFPRLKIIFNKKNIKNYIEKSDLVITTGGNVMFESLTCHKLTAVIQNYYHQRHAINFFKKRKCIVFLGTKKNLKISLLDDIYKNFENYNKKMVKNIPIDLDGFGTSRIKKIFENLLNLKT